MCTHACTCSWELRRGEHKYEFLLWVGSRDGAAAATFPQALHPERIAQCNAEVHESVWYKSEINKFNHQVPDPTNKYYQLGPAGVGFSLVRGPRKACFLAGMFREDTQQAGIYFRLKLNLDNSSAFSDRNACTRFDTCRHEQAGRRPCLSTAFSAASWFVAASIAGVCNMGHACLTGVQCAIAMCSIPIFMFKFFFKRLKSLCSRRPPNPALKVKDGSSDELLVDYQHHSINA